MQESTTPVSDVQANEFSPSPIGGLAPVKQANAKLSSSLSRLAAGPIRSSQSAPGLVDTTSQAYLTKNGYVAITATAATSATQLLNDLNALGLKDYSVFGRNVSGFIPVNALGLMEGSSNLRRARPVYKPVTNSSSLSLDSSTPLRETNVGFVDSEGDIAQRSKFARSEFNVSGAGVTIGVLSDSYDAFNEARFDIASGDLPSAGVLVLQDLEGDDLSDEGRAMLQIVHDVAPGAKLAFNTAFDGQVGFAQGIINLAKPVSQGGAGAKVIVDDVIYFDEPFYQDGIVTQAVNQVASGGKVAYFSSAGNQASQSYEKSWNGNLNTSVTINGFDFPYTFHDFDVSTTTADYFQDITIGGLSSFRPAFQWDQPFASASTTGKGSENDLDIFLLRTPVFDFSEDNLLASGFDINLDGDPFEFFQVSNGGSAPAKAYLVIGQFQGEGGGGPSPGRIKYVDFGGSRNSYEYDTDSSTSFGKNQSAFGLGVAASPYFETPEFGQNPPLPEPFTSLGGTPILFDTAGNRLPAPVDRNQPGITAPDGVSTTVIGFESFFGTSAAAPSAAAVAALILEKFPNATNQQIYNALKSTAIDMSTPGFDRLTGAGLIQADRAIRSLIQSTPTPPPGPPSVTLAVQPSSVSEDGTANLVYTFTRTGSTAGALTVNYKVAGTAKLGTDYTGISTTGTTKTAIFTAGSATTTVTVDPTIDLIAEPNETVSLTLATGTTYTIGTTAAVIGTIANDDIIGTSSANTLVGTAINEFIDGRGGQDNLTGGFGPDRFGFRFGESRIATPDRIADFEFGADIIDLLTSSGGLLAAPVAFSRAADNGTAKTLSALATSVFSDANGALTGNQALGANAAALVWATDPAIAGTYLVINDKTAGLSTTADLLINITGFVGSLPELGSLTVGSVFL